MFLCKPGNQSHWKKCSFLLNPLPGELMPWLLGLPGRLVINTGRNVFGYHLYELRPVLHFTSYFPHVPHSLFSLPYYYVTFCSYFFWQGILKLLNNMYLYFLWEEMIVLITNTFPLLKYKRNQIYCLDFIGEMCKQHFYSVLVHGAGRTFLRVTATWTQ